MKFAVGFQLYDDGEEPFSSIVNSYREHISEVFFAWLDVPTGRGPVATRDGYTDWSAQERTVAELRLIKAMGVKLDLLFNGNCYGGHAISKKLANTVISIIEYLDSAGCGIDIITTASLAVAHTVKKNFKNIEVRASVNMRIGTVKGMEYLSELFDSFHVQRDYNRDLERLRGLKAYADANGKKLIMLANSGCFSFCSAQTFHDNLVAHEAEVCEINNLDNFSPYTCWNSLKSKDNWHMLLENTWVRPEDLHHYDGIFDTVKLATRMHSFPGLVIDAYVRRRFSGNTLDLFEPGFGRAILPYIIDNSAFPDDWFTHTLECNKECHTCGYCKSVLEQVLLDTGDYYE